MYKKKISQDEFIKRVVNKELEIVNAPIRYDDIINNQDKYKFWFNNYKFKSDKQFDEFKKYFYKQFYEWQPLYISKQEAKYTFSWFNFMWGLVIDKKKR